MKKKEKVETVSQFIPELGLSLAKYSGEQLIDKVGQNIIKDVVSSILCGGNFRSLTEGLTTRRISLSNAAMLVTYLDASKNIKNFQQRIPELVRNELQYSRLSQEQKVFLQWLVGLTGKSIQNVLRSDNEQLKDYLTELESSLNNSIKQSEKEFGKLTGSINIDKENYLINWPSVLQLFTAIGAQTLAIRGSEKSMYGKLFEKLILGCLLTILGFELIDPKKSTQSNKVFWLSQRENKRESDATLLLKAGTGVRFDIGFIGPGNTEISLDKVSRFEREYEFGRQLHYMSTIVIVDRIGGKSRISELAKRINGTIIQMSMNYWVKEVCMILKETIGFKHKIMKLSDAESIEYIKDEMKNIDLKLFISNFKEGKSQKEI
ncbi:MAG TPA: CfrBI family restriction endonuclease [Hanamia sp.]|nr:CfrBI family restriction endonuclease [Hanamia sp.]